jgi:hypothetical protein
MTQGLRISAFCTLCGLLLLGTGAAAGAEEVQVRSVAGVATTSTIPPNVKQECNIQRDLPAAVAAHAPNAKLVPGKPKSGLYLDLVFTHVHAPPGGMFSGPKWLEARGTLQRGEKKLRSFRAKRISSGPFSRTCGTLAKVTHVMGQDIAAWLADENAGSLLGDAR